jgi:hypothetical protein
VAATAAAPLGAQQGVVTYDRATRTALELPPEIMERIGDRIPGETFESLVLLFSPEESVMIPAPEAEDGAEEAPAAAAGPEGARRFGGMMDRMRQTSPERSDQERLMVAHTDFATGATIENRTFMGRTFLIEGERPEIPWRLTGEQSQFAGHMVMKALATIDSTEVEAWFTPQIPIPAGPGEFGGLPGLILSLSIDNGRILYSATAVKMAPVDAGAIRPPTQGDEVSREEYEQIVAERLDDLRLMREQRGRRRGGGA